MFEVIIIKQFNSFFFYFPKNNDNYLSGVSQSSIYMTTYFCKSELNVYDDLFLTCSDWILKHLKKVSVFLTAYNWQKWKKKVYYVHIPAAQFTG